MVCPTFGVRQSVEVEVPGSRCIHSFVWGFLEESLRWDVLKKGLPVCRMAAWSAQESATQWIGCQEGPLQKKKVCWAEIKLVASVWKGCVNVALHFDSEIDVWLIFESDCCEMCNTAMPPFFCVLSGSVREHHTLEPAQAESFLLDTRYSHLLLCVILAQPILQATKKKNQSMPTTQQEATKCKRLQDKVIQCQAKHGRHDARCQMAQLQEKRCRAFVVCPDAAVVYYGTPQDDDKGVPNKALCAAWEEAKVFADPRVMKMDSPESTSRNNAIFEHHRTAMYKVVGNIHKRRQCQDYSQALSKCLLAQPKE